MNRHKASQNRTSPLSRRRPILALIGIAIVGSSISAMEPARVSRHTSTSPAPILGAQQVRSIGKLTPDKPILTELNGGQSHTYKLALASGDYVHLIVDQRGVDVVVTLLAPDGKNLCETDSPNGTQGPEHVYYVAETDGEYMIQVNSTEQSAPPGSYQILIDSLRPTSSQDRELAAGMRIFQDAERLRAEASRQSLQLALEKYKDAEVKLRNAGETSAEAYALFALGELQYQFGQREDARDNFLRALPFMREIHDRSGEAFVLNDLGAVSNAFGDNAKAIDYYQQALGLHKDAGNRLGEGQALVNLGFTYDILGERQQAINRYEQALAIFHDIHDQKDEAVTLNNLGSSYSAEGEKQRALDYYKRSLQLRQALHDAIGEGRTLNNIGKIYADLNDRETALDYYNRAMSARKRSVDPSGDAATLSNIGLLYTAAGEFEKAIAVYDQALTLERKTSEKLLEAQTSVNLGTAYLGQGDRASAERLYEDALSIFTQGGDRQNKARTLLRLGNLRATSDPSKGLASFQEALDLFRTIHDPIGESSALYGISRITAAQRDFVAARIQIERALDLLNTVRTQLTNQDLRLLYSASYHRYYQHQIYTLMQLHAHHPTDGFDSLALQAYEKSRARTLLELLNEAGVQIRQGVSPATLEKERSLRQRLGAKAEYQFRLLRRDHTQEQADSVAEEITQLTAQHHDVLAQIRSESPKYAALTQPQPLTLPEIQNELDQQTILLEYALGEEKDYLWLITPNRLRSFELPGAPEIKSLAEKLYECVTARSKRLEGETTEAFKDRVARCDSEFPTLASSLGHALLAPAAQFLGSKRLLIVAEGALQFVPFAALPDPMTSAKLKIPSPKRSSSRVPENASSEKSAITNPLILNHEIVILPSASTLAILRRLGTGRTRARKTLAVFADPVFSADDERVSEVLAGRATPSRASSAACEALWGVKASLSPLPNSISRPAPDKKQAVASVGSPELRRVSDDLGELAPGKPIPRLFKARLEAGKIASLVPANSRICAADFAASRTTALSLILADYRIVHFGSHAFIDNIHPDLSGLVLSLVDDKGEPQDGFLRSTDIFNLRLNADLVVLSACKTAVGKNLQGEGLLSVTRGFMYAGARRVIASLWSVDDHAAAELMVKLYREMLSNRKRPPSAALRASQVAMRKDLRWRFPYYWAGFVLTGEWK